MYINVYITGQLSSSILFDSGIHPLGIYNVTLSLSSQSHSMGLSQAAFDALQMPPVLSQTRF